MNSNNLVGPFRSGPLMDADEVVVEDDINSNNNNHNNPAVGPSRPQQQQPLVAFSGDPGAAWTESLNLNETNNINNNTTALILYRERERRQRTVRILMMFLLMLLLMDEESPQQQQQHQQLRNGKSKNNKNSFLSASQQRAGVLEPQVFQQRLQQDTALLQNAVQHPRYHALIQERNHGVDHYGTMEQWAQQRVALEKDEFELQQQQQQQQRQQLMDENDYDVDPDEEHQANDADTVWHYPWNATGFYRGEWTRQHKHEEQQEEVEEEAADLDKDDRKDDSNDADLPQERTLSAVELEDYLTHLVQRRYPNETAAVVLIPKPHWRLQTRNDHNLTTSRYDDRRVDSAGTVYAPPERNHNPKQNSQVTLQRQSGRAAFQLFSRSVPGMRQLSIVDGFVKLYDSNSPGYSTRQDVLLRVRGVLLHATGRLSLVSSNVDIGQCALVIMPPKDNNKNNNNNPVSSAAATSQQRLLAGENNQNLYNGSVHERTRQLQEALNSADLNEAVHVESVRNEALSLFENLNVPRRRLLTSNTKQGEDLELAAVASSNEAIDGGDGSEGEDSVLPPWSPVVLPYPFVPDDQDESIRRTRTAAARIMPPREQALEANAGSCGFEINMDVAAVEWPVGTWRKLVGRRVDELKKLDPAQQPPKGSPEAEAEESQTRRARSTSFSTSGSRRHYRGKPIQDEAMVVNMKGIIRSENCKFTAFLNTTALRTDWDATTSKAINYSFVMMLVCLTQILVLLRQLLHSQSQSTATRISLLCVGWQTNIDALLCLAHIYLSLAVQPLFTAFASVAFFKLLIFCVIEMKYMAIIIQARNSANGGQPTDVLRRQVAMLHLRFYLALLATFLIIFYLSDRYRMYYMLVLYSFWVPQIVMNIWTEARNPLHRHYIYGMSLTRVVAPMYIFAVPHNFLKEVYPDSPSDPWTVYIVILWVAVQTVILLAQSKYGARFMIPQRFLPPKFDYSRPIPPSMLPPGALVDLPAPEVIEDRDGDSCSVMTLQRKNSAEGSGRTTREPLSSSPATSTPSRHQTAETTRNRYKGSRLQHQQSSGMIMTIEEPVIPTSALAPRAAVVAPTLECSICYDSIDVRDRQKYMLAPCNHIFHRECLAQWMDVKMECPICRTELPAI